MTGVGMQSTENDLESKDEITLRTLLGVTGTKQSKEEPTWGESGGQIMSN